MMKHTTIKRASEIEVGDQLYLTDGNTPPRRDPWCLVVATCLDSPVGSPVTVWLGRDDRITFPVATWIMVRTQEDAEALNAEHVARLDAELARGLSCIAEFNERNRERCARPWWSRLLRLDVNK